MDRGLDNRINIITSRRELSYIFVTCWCSGSNSCWGDRFNTFLEYFIVHRVSFTSTTITTRNSKT